jgi:hypothetical protein
MHRNYRLTRFGLAQGLPLHLEKFCQPVFATASKFHAGGGIVNREYGGAGEKTERGREKDRTFVGGTPYVYGRKTVPLWEEHRMSMGGTPYPSGS